MLSFLERKLTNKEKRTVARYMSQYNNLEAIIKSKRLNLIPSKTSTIKENPVQESNAITSEADVYLEKKLEADEIAITKKKLDIVYNQVKPLHKLIWDEHFINGRADYEIYYDPQNGVSKRNYYREKEELMVVVAECLKIGTK